MKKAERPITVGANNISSIDFLVPLIWESCAAQATNIVVVINGDKIENTNKKYLTSFLHGIRRKSLGYRTCPMSNITNENIFNKIQSFRDYLTNNVIDNLDIKCMTIQSLFLHGFYIWAGLKNVKIIDINKPLRQKDYFLSEALNKVLKENFIKKRYKLSNGRTQLLFTSCDDIFRCSKIEPKRDALHFILDNCSIYKITKCNTSIQHKTQNYRFYDATGDLSSLFLLYFGRLGHCPWYLKKNTGDRRHRYSLKFTEIITPFSLIDLKRIEFRDDFFIPIRNPGAFLWDYFTESEKQLFANSILRINEPLWIIEALSCLAIRRNYNDKRREKRARLTAQILTAFYYKILSKAAHKVLKIENIAHRSKITVNIISLVKIISLILLYKKRYHPRSNFKFNQKVEKILIKNNMNSFIFFSNKLIHITETVINHLLSTPNHLFKKNIINQQAIENIHKKNQKTIVHIKKSLNEYQKKQKQHVRINIIGNFCRIEFMLRIFLIKSIVNVWEEIEDNAIASPINLISNLDKDILRNNITHLARKNYVTKKTISVNINSVRYYNDCSKN